MDRIWRNLTGHSLQAKALRFVALGTVVSLALLATLGYLAVQQTIDRSLEERRTLAASTAAHLESVMQQNLSSLAGLAEPLDGLSFGDLAVRRAAVRATYFRTIFDEGVYILDSRGMILLAEPHGEELEQEVFSSQPDLQKAMREDRMAVSSAYYKEPGHRPVVSVVVPLRDRAGTLVGWIAGSIDLTGPSLAGVIGPLHLAETGYAEVVDIRGVVVASTRPDLLMSESDHGMVLQDLIASGESAVRTCHRCHLNAGVSEREAEVMAFVPLSTTPWGVGIRQSQAEALAPVRTLRDRFALFGGLLMLVNLVLAFGISRGVLTPVRTLVASAGHLASGDLTRPIPSLGEDEVGQLGSSLETMRRRLGDSLETIRRWNVVLEQRVAERTRRLEEAQQDRQLLLQRIITAQEEERKRVARELHDDVSQNIVRLGLSLDQAVTECESGQQHLASRLSDLRGLADRTVDDVKRMIVDLRPSVLDDLGLVAAVQWYAEERLTPHNVRVQLEMPDEEERLPLSVEVALFRVAQEAVSNIARHASAENAIISVEFSENAVTMSFEDDGVGFDAAELLGPGGGTSALGILGMQERMTILGGTLTVDSRPGEGTVVSARAPLGF